jgi:heavy metal sensor kinase
MRITIGQRLTLWYGGTLAGSLAAMCLLVYGSFLHNLMSEIDRALDEELAEIEIEVRHAVSAEQRHSQLQKYFGTHPFYDIQIVRPDRSVVFQSARVGKPLTIPALATSGDGRVAESEVRPDGRRIRVASRVVVGFDGPLIIQAADSLEPLYADLGRLLAILLTIAPLVMFAALWGGYVLSRRALAPVDRLTETALRISASQLNERVLVATDDELGRLARAFNGMIDRLQQAFTSMQRFTSDAAHELRTPLAVLRSETEVALRGERSTDEYRDVLSSQLEEIDRMSRLADQLLFLSREDAGPTQDVVVAVRVDQLVEDVTDQMRSAAAAHNLTLEVAGPFPDCTVRGDPDRLRRLFVNLIDNSIKYTQSGGGIRVSGARENGTVDISVEDTGVGISAEHLPKLFDRFYRVDPARSGAEGSGLGLSICRAIVASQHGQIAVHSTRGSGTAVRVTFPVQSES